MNSLTIKTSSTSRAIKAIKDESYPGLDGLAHPPCNEQGHKKRAPGTLVPGARKGAVTYSPAFAVPSARRGLTSLFGMGRGGAPVLSPPESLSRTEGCGASHAVIR